MIEIFSSIIGFTPSTLDPEKNVSRTLNFSDDDFIICFLLNQFNLYNSVHLLHLLDKNELE